MKVSLPYGTGLLPVEVPGRNVTVIEPKFVVGVADEHAGFRESVRQPIGTRPLAELIRPGDRVAIVIPDITRPLPSDRLLPWLFEELAHVPAERFVIINGTGSHRANTPDELQKMVGADVVARYEIKNHDAHDPSTLAVAGRDRDGRAVLMNRDYVEADKRIVLGFIEPHFMAGFSGGYKGIFPAVAGIDSIMSYHGAAVVGHELSTWGVLDGNPTQSLIRASGSLLPLDFCINVTLNKKREISGYYSGDPTLAHDAGCAFAKSTAMVPCERPFSIVVTTNGGYPLDQNLYQAVKGMSAAAKVAAPGGFILSASRCDDGFPAHGNFRKLLFEHTSPRALLDTILSPGFSLYDQWQAQLLAMICLKSKVGLHSEIAASDVSRAHLEPVADVSARLSAELRKLGNDVAIAVLPEGPMTIPYLA